MRIVCCGLVVVGCGSPHVYGYRFTVDGFKHIFPHAKAPRLNKRKMMVSLGRPSREEKLYFATPMKRKQNGFTGQADTHRKTQTFSFTVAGSRFTVHSFLTGNW